MIETQRLKLVPLTHEHLLLYKNDPPELAKTLGLNYQAAQNDPATEKDHIEAIEFWIDKTLEHRAQFQWFTNWQIILKEEKLAIGGIGFAGLPDEEGKTMAGYGLDIRYHGKGYASEALGAICQWAFSAHHMLTSIVADTPIAHLASQKVLFKNGFVEAGRSDDLIHWSKKR